MDTLYGAEARAKIWELIKDIKVALMATSGEDGQRLRARPMMAPKLDEQAEFYGTLWFFTGADSSKVDELKANPQALLTFADSSKQSFVSVSGQATVERDQAKIDELWTKEVEAWFPEGRTDPNIALIRFEAEDAEYWDAPNRFVMGAAYIKSLVTGERPHIGETGKANLSH
ncbi:MAG: pyridoxamine 5'-phosphate oxidase family protein [Asticcacaulis sp.]